DLTRHACLIYTEMGSPEIGHGRDWRFETLDGRVETVRISGPLTSTNAAFVHQMALSGHGVVLGPSFSFASDIEQGRLIPLLTDWRTRELAIHAVYPHRALLSAKVRSFVDFLAERIEA